jgi:hypothetical protein
MAKTLMNPAQNDFEPLGHDQFEQSPPSGRQTQIRQVLNCVLDVVVLPVRETQ